MRFLFVAALHHPQQLRTAVENTPPGQNPPLFPPSVTQHFWERALLKRGHTLDVFYRNLPLIGGSRQMQTYTNRMTPGRFITGVMQRIPARINPDARLRNARLIEKARDFRPDILLMIGDNSVILPETLATIKRETGCKVLYACGTSPIVFSHPIERQAARLYDMVLAHDFYHGMQWRELGAPRMEVIPMTGCDPDFHHPYDLTDAEREAYTCDVAFVGTLIPDTLYSRRVKALEALRDFDLGIWSVHDVPDTLKPFVRGKALGENMLRILSASKITINVHGDFAFYGGNMRLFEAASVGVLQIADDLPGIHTWFNDGENIVLFKDADDLRDKVAYYLEHDTERQMIAQKALEHVYAHHTYDERIGRVLSLIAELPDEPS